MSVDDRISDIYSHTYYGAPWADALNTLDDLTMTDIEINRNTLYTDNFYIPQYLGTTRSYDTSNPDISINTGVYGAVFTVSQPSYYYSKYKNGTDEVVYIKSLIFLNNGSGVTPPSNNDNSMYEIETIIE